MSDIVERLTANTNKYPGFQNLNTEAAAEIDRLRARLAAWKAEAEAWRAWSDGPDDECDRTDSSDCASCLLWKDVNKARAAVDAIEKEPTP